MKTLTCIAMILLVASIQTSHITISCTADSDCSSGFTMSWASGITTFSTCTSEACTDGASVTIQAFSCTHDANGDVCDSEICWYANDITLCTACGPTDNAPREITYECKACVDNTTCPNQCIFIHSIEYCPTGSLAECSFTKAVETLDNCTSDDFGFTCDGCCSNIATIGATGTSGACFSKDQGWYNAIIETMLNKSAPAPVSAYITYQTGTQTLRSIYSGPTTTKLLNFKAGDIITIKSESYQRITSIYFQLSLAQLDQCGARIVRFKTPFIYIVRQSGEYLLALKNTDPYLQVYGDIQLSVEGKTTTLLFSGAEDSSWVQPITTPFLQSHHKLVIEYNPDLWIQSVKLMLGEQIYYFYEDWDLSGEYFYFISEQVIPANQPGQLIIEYVLGAESSLDIAYSLLIDTGQFCLDGIVDFQEQACYCNEGWVFNSQFHRCDNEFCLEFPDYCTQELPAEVWIDIFKYGKTLEQRKSLISLAKQLKQNFQYGNYLIELLLQAVRCMDLVFEEDVGPVFYSILSKYLTSEYTKEIYIQYLDFLPDYLQYFSIFFNSSATPEEICGFSLQNYTDTTNSSASYNYSDTKTATAFYISAHANSPEAISLILNRILSLSRNSEEVLIDNGIYYLTLISSNYYYNFLTNLIDEYVDETGIQRELALDYMIILLSQGAIPLPAEFPVLAILNLHNTSPEKLIKRWPL